MAGSETIESLFDKPSHNPSFGEVSRAVPRQIVDFCVPVNPYFPPPEMQAMIEENLPAILKYYPDYAGVHQQNIADLTGLPAENIVVANGSTEIITLLCRDAEAPLMTSVPTFGRWTDLPGDYQRPVVFLQRHRDNDFALTPEDIVRHVRQAGARTLVISNPNNPTGALLRPDEVQALVGALADLPLIIIDESFIDFAATASACALAMANDNLIVVKSMGKAVGWHGIRLGYAVAGGTRAAALRKQMPFWNINGLAAYVLARLPHFKDRLSDSFALVARDRQYLYDRLCGIRALKPYPSKANFVYCELLDGTSGKALQRRLLEEHGLFIRECSNKIGSSAQFLRIAVHPRGMTDLLIDALRAVLTA